MTIVNNKPQTELKTSDFYYDLPEELIAQRPSEIRDASRLLVVDRKSGELEHKIFSDIIDYLNEGDVLVVNDSKVIPARLYGNKQGKPDAQVELLLLKQKDLDCWETLVKPGKRARLGSVIEFGGGMLVGEIVEVLETGNRLIKFDYDREKYNNIYDILHQIGLMPLPP